MSPRHSLLAALVAVIWGANFVVIDLGLDGMPPLLFVALRFLAVLVPAIFLVRRPPVRWRIILGIGALTSLGQFGLLYSALHLGMPAGIASLVLQAQVVFTVVFAGLALRERPSLAQFAGITLGAVGLVVVGFGRSAETPLLAVLLTVAAAMSWATGNVVTRAAKVSSGLGLTVWSALVVPIPMFVLSLLLDGPDLVWQSLSGIGLGAILSTLYTALLSTLLGYGVWNTLLARYPAASVVPFTLLVPPVGILTAALVQHEIPGPAEWIGAVVVMLGVAVVALGGRRARRRSSGEASTAEAATVQASTGEWPGTDSSSVPLNDSSRSSANCG